MGTAEVVKKDELIRRIGLAITPRGKTVDNASAQSILHGWLYGFACVRSNDGGKSFVRTGENRGAKNLLITGESSTPRTEVMHAVVDEFGKEILVPRSKVAEVVERVKRAARVKRIEQIRRDLAADTATV